MTRRCQIRVRRARDTARPKPSMCSTHSERQVVTPGCDEGVPPPPTLPVQAWSWGAPVPPTSLRPDDASVIPMNLRSVRSPDDAVTPGRPIGSTAGSAAGSRSSLSSRGRRAIAVARGGR